MARFPDADVRRRFVEVKIAATLCPSQPSFGEARGVTLPQRPHHVVTVVAIPVSWLEPAPLDLGREDRLQCVEGAAAPGIESLLRHGQARAVTHRASSAGVFPWTSSFP